MNESKVPDAELFIASGCAHCPTVLAGLTDLLKDGKIGRLTVFNIAHKTEAAHERGVRSVPWACIGPFELIGSYTKQELGEWAERAAHPEGIADYLVSQLSTGQLDAVTAACRHHPILLPTLLDLAADLETPFAVRIGIGAVVEDLAPHGYLNGQLPKLVELAHDPQQQVRADAAHFLGLVGGDMARVTLETLRNDSDTEVREIAAESLDAMNETRNV